MRRSPSSVRFEHSVERKDAGSYLDELVVRLVPRAPRLAVRRLLGAGRILVNGASCPARYRVQIDDVVSGNFPGDELSRIHPHDASRQVLHRDPHLLVVNKAAGQLMVPGRDPEEDCLREALRDLLLETEPGEPAESPWVVHRLDRDTSGVCVWARTAEAHRALSLAFERREVRKVYLAIVQGEVAGEAGAVDLPLMQHPKDPMRMKISKQGQESRTEYRVVERFRGYTLLAVSPLTGRTHQVRVHLSGIRHPLVVDPLYGSARPACLSDLKADYRAKHGAAERPLLERTPLHAQELTLTHPATGQTVTFHADPPEDMQKLLKALRRHRKVAENSVVGEISPSDLVRSDPDPDPDE